jgi:hypothetical protein
MQCLSDVENGGWAYVRRVDAGSRWHPAVDDLMGMHGYNSYGVGTFSAQFQFLVTPDTEILFTTG